MDAETRFEIQDEALGNISITVTLYDDELYVGVDGVKTFDGRVRVEDGTVFVPRFFVWGDDRDVVVHNAVDFVLDGWGLWAHWIERH